MCGAADATGQLHLETLASYAVESRLEGGHGNACREAV